MPASTVAAVHVAALFNSQRKDHGWRNVGQRYHWRDTSNAVASLTSLSRGLDVLLPDRTLSNVIIYSYYLRQVFLCEHRR